ncbi:MAG: serine hydrolase [Patescibacteria group bacterium]
MTLTRILLSSTVLLTAIWLPTFSNNGSGSIISKGEETDFVEIDVIARSALVTDLLSGEVIFKKNPHELLPLASVSKIISSLVIAEHVLLQEYIEVTKSAVDTPEPSTLRVGEHFQAEDLLALAMGASSNDAITALVEHMGDTKWFLELMRQKGGDGFIFLNPTGLDIENESKPSNFGSAYALSRVIKNSLDSVIWQLGEKEEVVSKEKIAHKVRHTNSLENEISGIFGAKTGFTDSAGGNLVLIVERPVGKPKLIIILASTLEERFEDAKKLLNLMSNY